MIDAVLSSVPAAPLPAKGGVFALGNFDGVHQGHQAVVKTAIDRARGMGLPARVLTFEPHPRSVLKPGIAPFRLTPAPAKERILHGLGVDDVIVHPFTPEFSRLSAPDFVQRILIEECGAQHVVAGFDFVFGHKRGGDMPKLRAWLAPHSVGVTEVAPFRDGRGEMMSSTRAREALQAGDPHTAAHILGRPWAIAGVIEKGDQRGRELGAATANIALGEYLRPKFGVYAVMAGRVGAGARLPGVANIGVRPTVGGAAEMLEFHLFDFHDDLYGQEWEVELIDFLRPEQAFPDLAALRAQIARDLETARARLIGSLRDR
ncbi:MAG TPA: bifunctional riboflavin kinase/FAD synthetase [Alphaproteobacteria bacterium]|nr:bifunctional riboflavin kinase/FAD synthetase [Alphaproteobacteria bacterium]